jgi:osmotically-inducible protein OsmY
MDQRGRAGFLLLALVAAGCSSPPPNLPAPNATQLQHAANDALLTAAVKTRLIAVDPDSTTSLGVSVHDGVATLRGRVRSQQARERDLATARSTSGIRAVKDELRIDPHLPDVRTSASDAALAARIATAILTQTGSTAVKVSVDHAVVTLSGDVTDPKVHSAALATARHTTGVREVIDRMHGPTSTT